jgi:DNA helicase-2/ATP-dependent DNA helicase PcrA
MDILSNLNPEQKKAVITTDGPVLIIAGAGSGKTKVLTHRIAYLIYEKKINPLNILAITFTNKAADEMRKRTARILGRPEEERLRILPYLGTFHSICVRILREESKTLGFKSNFAIYDSTDQKTAIKKVMEKLQIDPKQFAPELILNMISGAKNELIGPKQYGKYVSSSFHEMVRNVYIEYQNLLSNYQALDFDDLIMKTVQMFKKNPEILIKWQNRFKYILVDEYQDTNRAQYVLVKMLAQKFKNICVVGDDSQAIYGWRGADIRNILNFENDFPSTKVIKLEQNYRSTKNILAAAQKIINKNVMKKEKNLWTENETGLPITTYNAQNEKDEGEFIVKEIDELKRNDDKLSYKDFVVLYRTNAQSRALEEIFLKYGVPYKIVGGLKFYSRKEIKDILAFLKLISNSKDLVSLERIINVPARGITPLTFNKILSIWETENDLENCKQKIENLDSLNSRAKTAVSRFIDTLKILHEGSEKLNVLELLDFVVSAINYKDFLLDGTIEGESRWENVQELKSVAEHFAELPPTEGLASFLEEVSLVSDIDSYDPNSDAVTLMTVHNAKGLEFSTVFMAGMEEGLFPHSKSLMEPVQMEEERRLCYVGMTRAKKRLYMIYDKSRLLYGTIQVNSPSRFLDDLPEELVDGIKENNSQIVMGISTPKKNVQRNAVEDFSEGDRIEHNKFGTGVIVQIEKNIASIAFAGQGVKKMDLRVAPMKKVE